MSVRTGKLSSSSMFKTSILKPKNIQVPSPRNVAKSTQATPKLGKLANDDARIRSNLDRFISRLCKAASAITNNIQLLLGWKPLTSLFISSNQQKMTLLGDQARLFAFRNGFGKSSNFNAMRPVQNWASVGGSAHASKVRDFGKSLAQNRNFSTTVKLEASGKKDGKECKKKGGGLPCLKPVGLGADDKSKKGDNKVCEKFCMPCCAPARDPPACVVAQKKRECKKFRPPRPAYSECKKDPMKPIKPCECLIQRLPPCGRSDQSQSNKNC